MTSRPDCPGDARSTNKLPANPTKETPRSMTSTVPPRDWTDIRLAGRHRGRAARWIAVLPLAATEQHGPHLPLDTDVMIGEAYLARVRELLPDAIPGHLPAGAAGRHFHRTHRLSGHADAADRRRAERMDGARRRASRARGIRKLVMVTSHGGNSAAMMLVAQDLRAQHRHARRHHELVALRRAGRIVLSGRTAPRHSWRRGRNLDHAGALSAQRCARMRSRIFAPRALRWKRNIAGSRRIGRRRSPGRRRIFIRAARLATPRWLRGERRAADRPRRASVLRIACRCR